MTPTATGRWTRRWFAQHLRHRALSQGATNLSRLRGVGATLEVAVHPARLPLELLFDVTFATFAPARTNDSGVDVTAELSWAACSCRWATCFRSAEGR